MKVAIIVGEVTGRGGMETVITSVVNGYNALCNDEMKLFVLGGSKDEQWLSEINSSHYFLLNAAKENKVKRYLKCITSAPKALRQYNPDIILAADEKSILYAKVISPFLNKKPKIGSWIHFSLTSIKPFYQKFIKLADFHLAISDGLKLEYIESGLSNDSNIHLVYNPINTEKSLIERPTDRAHFLYIGRLIYDGQKRVNDLLMALSELKSDWKLTVVGDGEDRKKLEKLASDLAIDNKISWLGWRKDPWESIDEATALLLTSEYEGLGMVLLEAMSRGIACVSSDCPVGPSNIIQNNINGWLYPPGDIKALSNLLNQIILKQKVLPSQAGIRKTVDKYDVRSYIENLNMMFEKCMRGSLDE